MDQSIDHIGHLDHIGGHLDLNDLRIYAHVADLGGFGRAADKLGLPKSTVSRRLNALEAQLGERLLHRTTRRQTLTEFGHLVLDHVRQMLAEADAVAALRERRRAQPGGRLRVSMPEDVANLLLADALAAFVVMYPEIQLELDLSARVVDLVGEGFDLAVRMGELPSDASLVARRLDMLPVSLYASPDYLAERGTPKVPTDLLTHRTLCLSRRGEAYAWTLERGDERWAQVPPGRVMSNAPEVLTRMACAGAGIAAVAEVLAAPDVRAGRLRRVLSDWRMPATMASAVFPGRKLMPAKTRVFIEMLQIAFASKAA